jgi:hypothetical protein
VGVLFEYLSTSQLPPIAGVPSSKLFNFAKEEGKIYRLVVDGLALAGMVSGKYKINVIVGDSKMEQGSTNSTNEPFYLTILFYKSYDLYHF